MARYIDADKLIAHLKDEIKACKPVFNGRANGKSVAYGTELGLKSAISYAETLPGADVVPKSEVEEAVRKVVDATDKVICEAKAELAREIFEDIARLLMINFCSCLPSGATEHYDYFEGELADDISELKKKYTEKGGE